MSPTALVTNGSNSMTSSLNFGNNKGINVLTPTLSTDVANKAYVDSTVSPTGTGWVNGGNTVSTTGSIFGTINNQAIAFIQNNQTIAVMNYPNFNINTNLLIGAGITITDTNLSALSLKQTGKLSNTAVSSTYGFKIYNSTT